MKSYVLNRFYWMVILIAVTSTSGLELPEELSGGVCSHEVTINLPKSRKCLVPVSTAYDWTVAQTKCEQVQQGGTLYVLPSGDLSYRPQLLRCLESMTKQAFHDMWINGVGQWSPQFQWVNNTGLLNRIEFCSRSKPPMPDGEREFESFSVDSCSSRCASRGYTYTVLKSNEDNLQCYCLQSLSPFYQSVCGSPQLNFKNTSTYYIKRSNQGSLIDVSTGSSFTTSDILCAMVDNHTVVDTRLRSDKCFSHRGFICVFNTTRDCDFIIQGRCIKRYDLAHTWYAATDYCRSRGGQMFVARSPGDVIAVSKGLDRSGPVWIGATNYKWNYNANSAELYHLQGEFRTARCAHIYRKTGPEGEVTNTMDWSDTPCDQAKSFLCQFDREKFKESEFDQDVICPWPIIDRPDPPPAIVTPPVAVVSDDSDSFPWAALISGLIAGLMLLSCLGLLCRLCCCDRWRRFRSKERVAFVPYFAGDQSHVEFETMSNADHMRGNMRSASEHGSQTGLVKGGYLGNGHSHDFSSKSLDRRHLEAMERKFAESQQYLSNSSMEERAYSSYQTMPGKGKDYMTLQANMRIQDDAELEAMRRSLRRKPEVTLVTDHMDMNFTVNHAHGNSTKGSDHERSMDDAHLQVPSNGGFEHRNRSFADIALHDL